jgi:hypothetical protein
MSTATNLTPPSASSDSLDDVKPYNIDQAMALLKSQIALLRKYFPDVDTTNLEESLAVTERDLRQHAAHVSRPGSSPGEESPALRQAKAALRGQLQSDLHAKLTALRQAHPSLPTEDLMMLLPANLVQAARRIESEEWMPKPEPVYRFLDTGKSSVTTKKLLEGIGRVKVEARKPKDDVGLELVEADHAERLGKETDKLMQSTPGLHRDIAHHRVLDANPELDDGSEEAEKLAAAQMEIKGRIKELQARNPKLTFRAAWESLQKSDPQLFEPLPAA